MARVCQVPAHLQTVCCVLCSFIHTATYQNSVEYLVCARQHTEKNGDTYSNLLLLPVSQGHEEA